MKKLIIMLALCSGVMAEEVETKFFVEDEGYIRYTEDELDDYSIYVSTQTGRIPKDNTCTVCGKILKLKLGYFDRWEICEEYLCNECKITIEQDMWQFFIDRRKNVLRWKK